MRDKPSPDMSAPVPLRRPLPLERLAEAKSVDDVVDNLDRVIEWAITAQSTIGYFAVLYKRSTVAVRVALGNGEFDDLRRMEEFDVTFAQRYFDALNAYFHPDEQGGLTMPWEVAFVGHQDRRATMIQQMMTGLNAHICFDLGTTAAAIAPNSLDTLEHDFNLINAILASQVPGVLDIVQKRSPALRWIRRVVPNEVWLINRLIIKFRTAAWNFAIFLVMNPDFANEKRVNQSAFTAALGVWYLEPPQRWTPFPLLVRAIAKRERKDVAGNIRALAGITNKPDKLNETFLTPTWTQSQSDAIRRVVRRRAARSAPVHRSG